MKQTIYLAILLCPLFIGQAFSQKIDSIQTLQNPSGLFQKWQQLPFIKKVSEDSVLVFLDKEEAVIMHRSQINGLISGKDSLSGDIQGLLIKKIRNNQEWKDKIKHLQKEKWESSIGLPLDNLSSPIPKIDPINTSKYLQSPLDKIKPNLSMSLVDSSSIKKLDWQVKKQVNRYVQQQKGLLQGVIPDSSALDKEKVEGLAGNLKGKLPQINNKDLSVKNAGGLLEKTVDNADKLDPKTLTMEKQLKQFFEMDSLPTDVLGQLKSINMDSLWSGQSKLLENGLPQDLDKMGMEQLQKLFKAEPEIFEKLGKDKSAKWIKKWEKVTDKGQLPDLAGMFENLKISKLTNALKAGNLEMDALKQLDRLLEANNNILPTDPEKLGVLADQDWTFVKEGKAHIHRVTADNGPSASNISEKLENLQEQDLLPQLLSNLRPDGSVADSEEALADDLKQKGKVKLKEKVLDTEGKVKQVVLKEKKSILPDGFIFENFIGIARGEDMTINLATQIGKRWKERYALGLGLTFQHTEQKEAQVQTVLGYKAFAKYSVVINKFDILLENVSLIPDISYIKVNEPINNFENTTLLGTSYTVNVTKKLGIIISLLYNFNDEIPAPALDAPWLGRLGIKF